MGYDWGMVKKYMPIPLIVVLIVTIIVGVNIHADYAEAAPATTQTTSFGSSVNCLFGNYFCSYTAGGSTSWSIQRPPGSGQTTGGTGQTQPTQSTVANNPQTSSGGSGIVVFATNVLSFLNRTIVPFILALAFLIFIWNIARYFIIGGAQEESRRKARRIALWGIIAFVFILSIWGIVNMLVSGLGFQYKPPLNADYIDGGTGNPGGNQNTTCTNLPGGFVWCSSGGSQIQHTPGSPPPTVNPNNPPQTTIFTTP